MSESWFDRAEQTVQAAVDEADRQLYNDTAREIFRSYFDLSPKDRTHVTWVMSKDWWNHLVRWELGFQTSTPPGLCVLLERPVEVRKDADFPTPEVRP